MQWGCWCMRTATLAALICGTECHSVLRWPQPRNRSPSNRQLVGPAAQSACGPQAPTMKADAPKVAPGVLTVWFSEAIRLEGSPWRLELTSESSDTKSCVLLDHIPHDINAANPVYGSV